MNRNRLTVLISAAASAHGYAFHSGDEHAMNGTLRVYPAAWLTPPVMRAHSGRSEGETTWRLTLHLMNLPRGASGSSSSSVSQALWRELETHALAIASSLAASDEVCAVDNVGCTPSSGSLTVHGEISVALTCDVTMWYRN